MGTAAGQAGSRSFDEAVVTFLLAHWPALLAAIFGLTCAAVSFITAEPPTTVSERCEPVSCPVVCDEAVCADVADAVCQRTTGGTAMVYCHVGRP